MLCSFEGEESASWRFTPVQMHTSMSSSTLFPLKAVWTEVNKEAIFFMQSLANTQLIWKAKDLHGEVNTVKLQIFKNESRLLGEDEIKTLLEYRIASLGEFALISPDYENIKDIYVIGLIDHPDDAAFLPATTVRALKVDTGGFHDYAGKKTNLTVPVATASCIIAAVFSS
jgi:hypothetical protein